MWTSPDLVHEPEAPVIPANPTPSSDLAALARVLPPTTEDEVSQEASAAFMRLVAFLKSLHYPQT